MSFLTENAISYTIKHLFKVAWPNLKENLKINVGADRLSARVSIFDKDIVFNISNQTSLNALLKGELELSKHITADRLHRIPIALKENLEFGQLTDSNLIINADIISLSFVMLSRYEEIAIKGRDKFDRFEFKNSLASTYNFIDFPIVDEYAMLLRESLQNFFPTQKFESNKCQLIPTHDIDEVRRFDGLKTTVKSIISDVYVYKNFLMPFRSSLDYYKSFNKPRKDPYITAIEKLIETSKNAGLVSEFYFMATDKTQFNNGYDPNLPAVKAVFNKISENNMIVGLHGGFDTFRSKEEYAREKKKLEDSFGEKVIGGRQHYLRFDINHTFKVLENSGLHYDSTLGYAEREGFRCGTCHAYNPYDFENDRPMVIEERPLIAMEVTLMDYRKLSIEEAFAKLCQLYNRCKAVEGNFILLWHNNEVVRTKKWFENVYCKFLNYHIQSI
jgi:hypothetical protein